MVELWLVYCYSLGRVRAGTVRVLGRFTVWVQLVYGRIRVRVGSRLG